MFDRQATPPLMEPLRTGQPRAPRDVSGAILLLPPLRIRVQPRELARVPEEPGESAETLIDATGEIAEAELEQAIFVGVSTFEFADSTGEPDAAAFAAAQQADDTPTGQTATLDQAAEEVSSAPSNETGAAETATEEWSEWTAETENPYLGEAVPEDEADLLAAAVTVGESVRVAEGPASRGDEQRLDEIAARLEGIARTLRDQRSPNALVSEAKDPLGALITGYLLGFFEGQGTKGPGSSG